MTVPAPDPPCGHCDVCGAGEVDHAAGTVEPPFAAGTTVEHDTWGRGQVMRADGARTIVQFAAVGYRTLSTDLVVEGGILRGSDGDARE